MKSVTLRRIITGTVIFLAGAISADARVVVHIGTVAPKGTPWHDVLVQMGQDWAKITEGEVKLIIHAGAAMGDELDLVKKMRIGQIQAVAMSGVGLSRVEPGTSCFQIPMMFDSYEELDYVREGIAPELERRLKEKNYIVLNWGDAGWVHFFTKKPATTPDDIRKMKLFISAGDAETLELYKAAGMQPVPLAITDILSSLQTGMIDAFDVPPLLAAVNQWFPLANNMLDVKWAPLVGATIIRQSTWEKIPARHRPAMLAAGRAAGEKLRGEIRKMSDDAIGAMEEKGLNVVHIDGKTLDVWREEAVAVYPKLRGKIIPADLFDRVKELRDEYRATNTADDGKNPAHDATKAIPAGTDDGPKPRDETPGRARGASSS